MGAWCRRRLPHRRPRGPSLWLPRPQRLSVVMKIAGVFLVAIGLEGIVTGQYRFTFVFLPLGVFISVLPIRIKTGVCIACRSPLEQNQAICPKCGAPQM